MDTIPQKYANMVNMINDILDEKNEFRILLNKTNYILFLETLKQYINNTPEEIMTVLFEKTKMNKKEFSPEHLTKFHRYLEFFLEITKIID